MKFVTFERAGVARPGLLSTDGVRVLDLSAVPDAPPMPTMAALIEAMDDALLAKLRGLLEDTTAPWQPMAGARLIAPIPRPPRDILCVGVNYHAHREEFEREALPPRTVYFLKRAPWVTGPGEAIPGRFDLDASIDYEVELAVVIGKRGRDIRPEDAEAHIFGYSVLNDVSARVLQRAHLQWFRGKSLDGYTAMGPCILHRSALPFPVEVDVESRVNGEVRQQSNTRLLIAGLAQIIAELSAGMTLLPGDIIATGTPGGVGAGFDPPRFLRPGDTVACEIGPIGVLENPVADASPGA